MTLRRLHGIRSSLQQERACGAPRVDCSRAGQRRNLLFPFLYSHHDTRWLHASAAVSLRACWERGRRSEIALQPPCLPASHTLRISTHLQRRHLPALRARHRTSPCRRLLRCSGRQAQPVAHCQHGGASQRTLHALSCRPRVHGTQKDARTKFDGERRRARRVPGVPGENPSPLETVSICVRPHRLGELEASLKRA